MIDQKTGYVNISTRFAEGGMQVFDENNCFERETPKPGDPDRDNRVWYVYVQTNREGICQVTKSAIVGFWELDGPMTFDEADNLKQSSKHCDAYTAG
ncbi:MAG: hypothetical protein WA884_10390 [Methyloceanibacter sp.]